MVVYDTLECQMSDLSHGNHELERHPATPRLASFPQMQLEMEMH